MNTTNYTNVSPRVRVIPAKKKVSINSQKTDGQKLRVAVYARVSTLEEHQNSSYDLQVSYYKEYIQSNPKWELYKVYADEGISGTSTKNRTGFLEMIKDAKEGKFDYIITKSISRFARNTLTCISVVRELKSLPKPCGVYFEKENIDTLDSKSEFLLAILSSISQEESKNISDNVRWSIQKAFSQGKIHCPTTYFLGYDTDENGNIVIDEEQAKVVRRIFSEFLKGKGTPTIANELMRDGVLTARGKPVWTSDSVRKILKNEKYMGHCLAQKTVTLDFLTHKRVKNDDHQPQFFVKDCLPQIISEKDWYKVQQELKRRNDMMHNPDEKYRMCFSSSSTFSNKLFCGECGRPVTRRRLTSRKGGKEYKFTAWHCRVASLRDLEFKGCKAKYVWEEELEKAFMKTLNEMKDKKEQILKDVESVIKSRSLTKEEENRLEELEEKLESISIRISDLASREPSSNDAIYDATMRNLIYEQEILQMEHENLEKVRQENMYLRDNLDELFKYLEQIEGDRFREDIFLRTVEKAIVYDNYEISFVFKCGIKQYAQAKRIYR
jgi:site-specific DNA recombinase